MDLVPHVCLVNYLEKFRLKPKFMESTEYILMIGMPVPWNIYCNRALDIPVSLTEN